MNPDLGEINLRSRSVAKKDLKTIAEERSAETELKRKRKAQLESSSDPQNLQWLLIGFLLMVLVTYFIIKGSQKPVGTD